MRFTAEDETRVAAEFCRRVCADVMEVYGDSGAAALQTIRELNRTDNREIFCATHDYIDPNQSLIDAMENCGFSDLEWSWENDATDEQIELIEENVDFTNRVWSIAKSAGFNVDNLIPAVRTGSAIELRTYGGLESGTINGRDMTDIANDVDWRNDAIDRIQSGDVGQSAYDIGLALALAGF